MNEYSVTFRSGKNKPKDEFAKVSGAFTPVEAAAFATATRMLYAGSVVKVRQRHGNEWQDKGEFFQEELYNVRRKLRRKYDAKTGEPLLERGRTTGGHKRYLSGGEQRLLLEEFARTCSDLEACRRSDIESMACSIKKVDKGGEAGLLTAIRLLTGEADRLAGRQSWAYQRLEELEGMTEEEEDGS